MNSRLQDVYSVFGFVVGFTAILFGGQFLALANPQGYRMLGVQAPQLLPNPISAELEQKLKLLQGQLRDRSIEVSLLDAIEQSMLNNPDLAQSYSQIQQRQWNLIAVRRQWYPTLTASSGGPASGLWGYRENRTATTLRRGDLTFDQQINQNEAAFVPILSLRWTFFDASRGAQINSASESLRSQQLLFNVAARNLVLQTQLSYFNLQEQQNLIAAYENILDATRIQVKQTESLFNIGQLTIADVEQIRAQQFQTLTLLFQTYSRFAEASATLARVMALPPGQLVLPQDTLNQYGEWDLPLISTIDQAQVLREEIKASLADANSARWRASALFNSYIPRFALLANGSYADVTRNTEVVSAPPAERQLSRTWDGSVGIGFTWSIFDGGIAAAQGQADKALSQQFSDQASVQRLQVTQEVEQSYARYSSSRLALLSSREQAKSAQIASVAVRERFNVGVADITTVVQTLNQAIAAENAYSFAQREYNSSVASLFRVSAQWPQNTDALLGKREKALKLR